MNTTNESAVAAIPIHELRDGDLDALRVVVESHGTSKNGVLAPEKSSSIDSAEVAKAGFTIGGTGGRAVLLAKDAKSGKWVGPAFYTLATASVGFQAGISVSEMVTLVMTDKGFNSLLATSFKMGADASVAAGPVGAGAKSDIVVDLIAFSRKEKRQAATAAARGSSRL